MTDIKIHRPQIQSANKQNTQTNRVVSNPYQYVPGEVLDFAKSMESQFSELMLKEMQKTTNDEDGGTAGEFYNGLLTTERAKAFANNSSHSIKDMVLDEVYPKYKRTAQNYAVYEQHKNQFNRQNIRIHDGPSNEISKHESGNLE